MRHANWGTPGRSTHFLKPRGKYALLLPSLGIGLLLAGGLLLAHLLGFRKPVSPGSLIGAHTQIESRCEECHAPHQGASNLRCQRCHDPAGAGRMTNGAHVLFGSLNAKKAAAAPNLDCAGCHVDHRGRAARLTAVDENLCHSCHFRGFGAHPEFAVLREPSQETPGVMFSHVRHLEEMTKQGGGSTTRKELCLKCHESNPKGRDFDAISFDRHCASCHAKDGSLGTIDPVSLQDVVAPDAVPRLPTPADGEFETSRGRISKTRVRHRDEWVTWNLAKLRRDAEPDAWAAERGALLARMSQLRRRLVLSTPLAALDSRALAARAVSLQSELSGADFRLKGLASGRTPTAGLERVDEALIAIAGSAEAAADARKLKDQVGGLRKKSAAAEALPAEDYDARRKEILSLLEAVDAADPTLKPRVEDLRRRLLALAPGENGLDLFGRVRDQRLAELDRVRDEMQLRADGIKPPAAALLVGQRRVIEEAITATRLRLEALGKETTPSTLTEEERTHKQDSLAVVAAPCTKCHVLAAGALAPVSASKPVLVRARFMHQPHLMQTDADCSRCHPGIEKSKASKDLNLRGIDSCRECHKSSGTTVECQSCHRYHPPAAP